MNQHLTATTRPAFAMSFVSKSYRAMASKIKFDGTGDGVVDGEVHFTDPINDYTLCGLTLDGDPLTAGGYESTKDKVNCDSCIRIVKLCKTIKNREMCVG